MENQIIKLQNSFEKIKVFILRRYKDNLAAILVFGSANTGHYREGKSDIDTMIFLKKLNGIGVEKEINFLIDSLKEINFRTQYFHSLESIKEYLIKRVSWSTYLTIVSKEGSTVIYTTPEFEKLKKELIKNSPLKEAIKNYVIEKDNFELEGYFKEIKGFDLTKALMSHLRRKLQIIVYLITGKFIFDYRKCLKNIDLDKEEREKLDVLYCYYETKKELSNDEINKYYTLAKNFTNNIVNM